MTDVILFVIEESPKSARRGLPCTSIRMLAYRKVRHSQQSPQMVVGRSTYTFQVSVNHLVQVKIVETPRDATQLNIGDELDRASRQSRRTHKFHPIDVLLVPQIG